MNHHEAATIDLTGKRFTRLQVVGRDFENRRIGRFWVCKCDCGTTISVPTNSLMRGSSKSCGCFTRDRMRRIKTTHNMSFSTEYRIWAGMKYRCHSRKCPAYRDYGGRGIKVCERWETSFENFLADMGRRPKGSTLDRINNDGPYSPENCRWVSWTTQHNNRRGNVCFVFHGSLQTIADIARSLGVKYAWLHNRLRTRGMTVEEATRGYYPA
jgi:hypothetical protein